MEQFISNLAFQRLISHSKRMYITPETLHSALRRSHTAGIVILPRLILLEKGKYLKRWARRLRELGFTREDAFILSYATFGIDRLQETFGVEVVITLDLGLMTKYRETHSRIAARFRRMIHHLRLPYSEATLPKLMTPQQVLYNITS